jgi:hypothetical protein
LARAAGSSLRSSFEAAPRQKKGGARLGGVGRLRAEVCGICGCDCVDHFYLSTGTCVLQAFLARIV